jgi:protein subunit release factor A
MESILIELRAGEGGADAKSLVTDILAVCLKAGERRGL